MKRLATTASLTLAVSFAPSVASAGVTSIHAREYQRAYRAVSEKYGRRAPGRNIMRWGMPSGHAPSDAQVMASLGVLQRILAPPPVVNVNVTTASFQQTGTTTPTTSSPPVTYSSAGAGGVPACASESGTNYSTGPANTNASSGATGRYQITPPTAANYGCNLSTPAGQDACAGVIYAHQGTSAWVGCGG